MEVNKIKNNIYNKIKTNGSSLTISHGISDYNPVTDTESSSIIYKTYCIQTSLKDISRENVQLSDFKLIVPAIDNNNINMTIEVEDKITKEDGTKIKAYAISKTAPTGETIMFTIYCHG